MKAYIKPMMEYVELKVEEKFAVGSVCESDGACTVNGVPTLYA